MKCLSFAIGLVVLALPAGAAASPSPSDQDRQNAARECFLERGSEPSTREAFYARYGSFGTCVSRRSRDEHAERHRAVASAMRQCADEREADSAAFREKYGTEESGDRNAFGRCVSQHAREHKQSADAADAQERRNRHNAARQCDEERGETPQSREAFRERYGEPAGARNAFGRCVSEKAQAQNDG